MKKFLSIILAILMVVTMIPMAGMPASAAENLDYNITVEVVDWAVYDTSGKLIGEFNAVEHGDAFYDVSLTQADDGTFTCSYQIALERNDGNTAWNESSISFKIDSCEDEFMQEFEKSFYSSYNIFYNLKVTRSAGDSHTFKDATCVAPKTCAICGVTKGDIDATAHSWANLDGICANGCGATCAHENQTGLACEICGADIHVCSNYNNGFCTECDAYEPATLVTNENYESFYLKADYVGYYAISNGGQLFWYANYINTVDRTANAVLTADIDLENRPWTPIGSTGENNNNFRGVFDGQNYIIKGLYVEGGRAGLGFFGEVRTGTVKNFTIFGNVVVNTEVDYIGGVIGSICGVNGETDLERNGAIIQNITSFVNVTAKAHGIGMIGGFVGYANHQSLIEKCAWYGTFDAGEYRVDSGAGGFIGKIQENTSEVTIRDCGAYGTIKTNYAKNSYNNTPTIYMGGFLSFSNTGAKTTIENCLFAGRFERGENLTDEARLGAFGTLRSVNAIKNCYYLGDDGLEAVHSDSDLKPGDNIEITSVTGEDLRGEMFVVWPMLGEYWTQGIHYPIFKEGQMRWHSDSATYTYTDNGDGTHKKTCNECGYVEEVNEEHYVDPTTTYTDNGNGTHSFKCAKCDADVAKMPHTLDITTGKCSACGADMTAIATVTDGTNTYYAADAATLNQAVTAILETGSRTFTVELPADTEAEMITAIRRAICDTEGVADGSINLTLKGVTSIPGTTNWDGVAFGPGDIYDEAGEIVDQELVTQLASINLPDATEIGAQAFYFCENLVSVSAPKAQTIGAQAFGYTALTSVEFPELTTIPTDMFSGTWTLSSAKFPKVTTIEQNGLLIGAKFNPENNPTPFPLELTAEGDITFNGSNHFNIAEQNYSGKVDLVLCCDKKDDVTFHDDGTATWQVRDDLSYTFKSITFKHSYTDGVCTVCGYECPHESYTDGKCGVCGYECPHEKVTDGICDACAAEVNIITITMNDSYGDGWNGNAVVIKQFVDGVYTDTEAGTATIEDGESGTFTTVLPKDGIFALSWLTGEFPSECSFTIAVDGETVYECADGSTLTDGQMIYVTCEHTSYTDGKCDVCGYECTHESYTNSKCDACGYICTHEGQNGSCQVCGANLGELVIDVTDEQYVHIGIGEEYYDEDGYIITGNNPNVEIWVYEGGNYTLDGVTAKSIVDRAGDDTVNITLKGNNVFTGSYSFYKADLIINAVDGATLKALYVTTSGNDGTLTVNGGDITFAYEGNENYNTLECKKIIINGGTVTASNSAFYTVDQNVELNGGILNVVNTSTDFEAISNDVIIDKGALLTISSTYKLFHDAYDILKAEGLAENDFFFVRYDTESEFVPVQDIESALNGKAYAEIKIDTHEHSYTDGICDCGYVCLHVNFADGICPDCTASGKLVAIKMSDSNNDGWYGKNAVVIKQLVDGAFEEVETATLTDGKSGTVAVNLDKDGTYVITWQSDYYPNECGFEIYVDGECVYSISDASGIENNAILYTICEHTGGKADCLHRAVCENCGNEYGEVDADGHDWSNKDGVCDNCEYACPHENVTGATCITPVKCDVCGYSVFDWTNHEGEYVTVWYNDYQHVSEYECCHIGSSIVYGDHDYKDYTVTTPADCVNNAWETGTCICGDTHVREIADSATDHNWSNKDGICANGCGETCPHESYTDGVCDKCGEECAHEWDEGVLTRPVYDAVLGSKDGCYTYTCTVCGKEKKETVKSADYSAYEAVSEEINALLQSDELTSEAMQAIYSAANECGLLSNDLTESEQNIVDDLVAELEKIVDTAEEKIASGEYVKADYTEIDEAIASVDEALENATISEEMANELSDIKSQLEALKENENTSIADAAELLERVKAVAETMADCANGIHSFTKYEEVTAPECGKTGLEKADCDHGCGATDEREIPALTHEPLEAVKENEVAPKCGVAGSYDLVVYCDLCGDELDRDTVTVDALTHTDEDGDYLCDHGCGHEFEKPAEPDTPDEPADGDCDHLCHKSGIMSIFWKIIRFFYRLFNIQQYCDCGVIHYDAPFFG